MIELRHLTIGHRRQPLAAQLHATLAEGCLTALVGRNGAGKSTLLRTMAGLHPPLEGEVLMKGRDLSAFSPRSRARRLAVVLTDRFVASSLTVREVVEMGRTPYSSFVGTFSPTDRMAVERAIEFCRIGDFWKREIGSLSDGERQRVMIARALAQDTPCILLDEPTAFLDFPAKIDILSLLLRMTREEQKTILLSTHDLEIVFQLAHRLWLLTPERIIDGRPGQLAADGSIEQVLATPQIHLDASTLRFDYAAFS